MAATVLTLALLNPIPVLAHTNTELGDWLADWQDRQTAAVSGEAATGDYRPLADLSLEYADYQHRHPCWDVIGTWTSGCERQAVHRAAVAGGVEQWRPLIAAHFPASQVDTALCVVAWESAGDPSAKNPYSSARGLFQILASLWAPHYGVSTSALYDPETNTRIAADIWNTYGWDAWSARSRGHC